MTRNTKIQKYLKLLLTRNLILILRKYLAPPLTRNLRVRKYMTLLYWEPDSKDIPDFAVDKEPDS